MDTIPKKPAPPSLILNQKDDFTEYRLTGAWTVAQIEYLQELENKVKIEYTGSTIRSLYLQDITEFDTYGAFVLERILKNLGFSSSSADSLGLPSRFRSLYEHVCRAKAQASSKMQKRNIVYSSLENIGRSTSRFSLDFISLIEMIGAFFTALVRVAWHPKAFRITSTIHHLDRVAWQAVPIILLITFLIGGIIAQQGIFHFRKFGADVYVVDMVGILVLREIGVLIVAIMVAGRSGSSYTAELGSMKMREEIDALQTMGLNPVEILILPRILALILALPILTFLGSMSALYGGQLVAWLYGGMSPEIFLERLKEAISITHFKVGMIKAPFMAFVIGVVSCAQGLQVKGSAESLGLQTTASVVKSIFLVIVLDGFFAVFFASIDM
ncbi:MAG: MlaE family ABC transporter permease [Hyphomicrobium sp.]